jgi:hypothetical protein
MHVGLKCTSLLVSKNNGWLSRPSPSRLERGGGVSLLRVYYTTGFVMLPWPLGPGVCLDSDGCKNFSPLLVVLLNS